MPASGAIRAGRAFVELFADDSRLVRGLRRAEARIRNFGSKLQGIGSRMAGLGIAAAVPIAGATKIFAGFDDQMRAVQAVIGATGEQFNMLNDQAKMLGRTTSFSAEQVASGMLELGRAGFDPAQIEAAIPSVLALSRATGTELAESSNIAANTLRAFGLEAGQMTRVSDVMTATANNSAQTLTDLGEAMKYVAPIAAEAGMSLEDTGKTIGALANFGIKGSMAGTTLKNILQRMADPSVQKQFARIGVSATDARGNLRPLADVMRDVGRATDHLPNAKRLEVFNKLFGMRAIAGGAKLTAAAFERLNTAVDNSAGSAAKTAKVMDSGIGGAMRRLYSALEGIAIAIGDALGSELSTLADWIGTVANKITDWISKNKKIIVIAAGVIAGIIGTGVALIAMGLALKVVAVGFGVLATVATVAGTVFSAVGSVIGFLCTPIGLVVVALAGLGAYFLYASGALGKATAWLGDKFGVLKDDALKAFGGISDALAAGDIGLAMKVLWLTLKMEWTRGVNFLEKAWLNFRNFFIRIGYDAWSGLLLVVNKVWGWLESGWIETTAFFSKAWTMFTSGVAASWEVIKAAAGKTWNKIKSYFNQKYDSKADNRAIDREKSRRLAAIGSDMNRQLSQREAERQRQHAQSSGIRKAVEGQILQDNLSKHAALDAEYESRMSDNERDLLKARQEWQDAINEARKKREEKEAEDDGPGTLKDPAKILAQQIKLAPGTLGKQVGKMQTFGTFNPAALNRMFSFGGKSPEARIEEAIKKLNADSHARYSELNSKVGVLADDIAMIRRDTHKNAGGLG